MAAFKEHGNVALTLTRDTDQAQQAISTLGSLGLDLNAITDQLEKEGVRLFIESFNALLESIQSSMQQIQQQAKGS
jgi:transaldolase